MPKLPYDKEFNERNIPTIQINEELSKFCKTKCQSLFHKNLLGLLNSLWICTTFYNQAEKEHGVLRSIINYKPLNKLLQWKRHLISNKKGLLEKLYNAKRFSMLHMRSNF